MQIDDQTWVQIATGNGATVQKLEIKKTAIFAYAAQTPTTEDVFSITANDLVVLPAVIGMNIYVMALDGSLSLTVRETIYPYSLNAGGDEAANVISEESVIKLPQIIPKINGVPTGEINLDALTTAKILSLQATINSGDPFAAANRLANGFPDVLDYVYDKDSVSFHSKAPIIDFTTIMYADKSIAATAYNAGTKTATGVIITSVVEADYKTSMVEFNFDSDDKVTLVILNLHTFTDLTTDENLGKLTIAGYSL